MPAILERFSLAGINNAGIGTAVPALREDPDDFRRVIDVNLSGSYFMAQACAGRDPRQRTGPASSDPR
jgi:NAD(P)-dependent dehydrogenase (short-subunit alcohol dehydrogenase family)